MSMPGHAEYELYAIKYAERPSRRSEQFLGGDAHDAPMAMAYYVWLARNAERAVLIDTGFNAAMAAKRKRTLVREPRDGLALLGVQANDIRDVIITHLHNDHVGTFFEFPNARLHLQDREMAYATGRCMCSPHLNHAYEVDHVVGVVRLVYEQRVVFHDGDDEIFPGITVHHLGGHTAGIQAVRVWTQRGWVVLASDASHHFENFETRRCHPGVVRVDEMLVGFDTILKLAASPRHVIPGHDPLVLERYPPPREELRGAIARLDVEPVG